MNVLVSYYTRTGNTKKVAKLIADELNADIEEIIDKTKRSGIIGWLKSAYHATREKTTEIEDVEKDPSKFDLIILGTPNWNTRMSPAIRTYIMNYKEEFKDIAVFCSAGGRGVEHVLETMSQLCEKEPIAKRGFLEEDAEEKRLNSKVKEFVKNIQAGAS
ncbi:MAG: flavodoxin family protein [Promethearchaeota archaeon]